MAFREVSVYEIREVLRLWLGGRGIREIARVGGVDRKTIRRYIAAAEAAGLSRDDDEGAITEEVIGAVVEAVRPLRPGGHGSAWDQLLAEREHIKGWLEDGLSVVKVHDRLATRRKVHVPYSTLHRFCRAEFGIGRRRETVRLVDGKPGEETQCGKTHMVSYAAPANIRRRV